MVEILCQDEIDALLSAIETGDLKTDEEMKEDVKHRKIKIYDYKRPDFFTKRQSDYLSNKSREYFEKEMLKEFRNKHSNVYVSRLDIVSVDQITHEEFIRSINNPTYLQEFKIGEYAGYLEFNAGLVNTFSPLYAFDEKTSAKRLENMHSKLSETCKTFLETLVKNIKLEEKVTMSELFTDPKMVIHNPNDMVLLLTYEFQCHTNYSSGIDYFDKLTAEGIDDYDDIDKVLVGIGFDDDEYELNCQFVKVFRENWDKIKEDYDTIAHIERIFLEKLGDGIHRIRQSDEEGKQLTFSDKIEYFKQKTNEYFKKADCREGIVNVSFPIHPFLKKFYGRETKTKINKEIFGSQALKIEIEAGRSERPVQDLQEISTGAVIELDTLCGEEFDIYAGGLYLGKCRLGVEDEYFKVKIVNFRDRDHKLRPVDRINSVCTELRAIIGHTYMTSKQASQLEIGSEFKLEQLAGQSILVKCGNNLLYRGELVVIDENFGFRVTSKESNLFDYVDKMSKELSELKKINAKNHLSRKIMNKMDALRKDLHQYKKLVKGNDGGDDEPQGIQFPTLDEEDEFLNMLSGGSGLDDDQLTEPGKMDPCGIFLSSVFCDDEDYGDDLHSICLSPGSSPFGNLLAREEEDDGDDDFQSLLQQFAESSKAVHEEEERENKRRGGLIIKKRQSATIIKDKSLSQELIEQRQRDKKIEDKKEQSMTKLLEQEAEMYLPETKQEEYTPDEIDQINEELAQASGGEPGEEIDYIPSQEKIDHYFGLDKKEQQDKKQDTQDEEAKLNQLFGIDDQDPLDALLGGDSTKHTHIDQFPDEVDLIDDLNSRGK